MVKLDYDRDYYADLELPPSADSQDIKTQFRKLALKWHPDRNHGREEEAKAKFVIIQSAQEILLDSVKKAKYDAERKARASRYPTASGVRGNPYQNVSSQYPVPPKRPPMPTRPMPSGSDRYSHWVPKQPPFRETTEDTMRNNTQAWERMRKSGKPGTYGRDTASAAAAAAAGAGGPSPRRPRNPDPQAVPRSNTQRQRAEAAFGTRKPGFVPNSPLGDEPPVTSKNYSTTRSHTSIFDEFRAPPPSTQRPSTASSNYVDPLSKQFSETFLDTRHSTPYMSHPGEKTNLFEGAGRAKSMRDPEGAGQRRDGNLDSPSSSSRRRSFSVPQSNQSGSGQPNDAQSSSGGGGADGDGESNDSEDSPSFSFKTRSHRQPQSQTKSAPNTATFNSANNSTSSVNTGNATFNSEMPNVRGRHSAYEAPFSSSKAPKLHPSSCAQSPYSKGCVDQDRNTPRQNARRRTNSISETLNTFEDCLQSILGDLVDKKNTPQKRTPGCTNPTHGVPVSETSASTHSYNAGQQTNTSWSDSFSMPVDDDVFEPPTSTPKQNRFTRNSADSINTRFAAGENGNGGFRFHAGGPSEDDPFTAAKRHHRESLRAHRSHSPIKEPFTSGFGSGPGPRPAAAAAAAADMPQQNNAPPPPPPAQQSTFDADQWAQKIGAHNFVPPQPTGSPTRPVRPIKKAKPVKMTAGTAGLVDEDETSSEESKTRPTTAADQVDGAFSPNAMDIDTPPRQPTPLKSNGGARNINVEPSNPEWRAGNVNGVKTRLDADSKIPPPPTSSNATTAGSEDSDDFLRSNFSDFVKVEPFAPAGTASGGGLGSMGDLKSSLPFESKASAKLHIAKEKPKPLAFPHPPVAPRPSQPLTIPNLPVPAAMWASYAREFNAYMAKWAEFNGRVTDHFAARRRQVQSIQGKDGTFDCVNARDDAGIEEYLHWLAEDKFVRQKWMVACEEHELQVRQFMKLREKAKK